MSNLDWKILPRIKFWFEILTPCQAFNQKVHNVSGFDSKILPLARFWVQGLYRMSDFDWWNSRSVQFSVENFKIRQFLEKVAFKSSRGLFSFRKIDIFYPIRAFSEAFFWKKHCLVSDLSWKKSQRVRFWIKCFTTWQFLNWKFPNVSDFDLKSLPHVIIWLRIIKKFQALKWKVYNASNLDWEGFYLLTFELRFLHRVRLLTKKFTTCQVLTQNSHQVSHFESKTLQRFKFCMKKVLTGHFLKYKFYNVSDFASKVLPLVRFWVGITTMFQALS